jgi:hypothetical protein
VVRLSYKTANNSDTTNPHTPILSNLRSALQMDLATTVGMTSFPDARLASFFLGNLPGARLVCCTRGIVGDSANLRPIQRLLGVIN